jgi:excisionase family DNA binding protein
MTVSAVRRHSIPEKDKEPARNLLRTVEAAEAGDRVYMVVVRPGGERVHAEVPPSMLASIEGMVELMAAKGEATVIDDEQEITPEEAAPLLGMSRPMVVHRIKQGDIPHRMVGTHHRLKLSDVLAFREEEERRLKAMAEIGEHTDEMTIRYGL